MKCCMSDNLKKFLEVFSTGLGIILNSRKFVGITIFLFLINTLPSLVAYVIALKKPAYVLQQFVAQFYATWLVFLISNIFSVILPLFITNIVFSDQIRLKRIFNLAIRPIKREHLYIGLNASIVAMHALIGILLGIYLYTTIEIGLTVAGKNVLITPEIALQLLIFLTITSYFYSTMMTLIIFILKDYGLRSIILFFIITLIYDVVLSAIGGSYNLLTISYYKTTILANTITDRLIKEEIVKLSPIRPGGLMNGILVLLAISTIFFIISLTRFRELEIV